MTQSLAQDRPTIDSAIKSYISMICARSLTASSTDASGTVMGIIPVHNAPASNAAALEFARILLKAVNSYRFPVHETVEADVWKSKPGLTPAKLQDLLELSVTARLWNGLAESQQKPSRFLGQRALRRIFRRLALRDEMSGDEQMAWLEEFEHLLYFEASQGPSPLDTDDNAALIWSKDGGAAELAKRRQRRKAAAEARGTATTL